MVITKFEDILADLDEALDFARSLGVKVAGSRFELYRDRIAEWVRLAPQRGLPEPSERDDGLDSVALTEAVELGQDIVPFLRDVDPVIAANKLRHLFRGADRPGDDDSDSAMGRNTAFEISLAETFRRARIPVKLGEPDLVAQIGRRQIFIACKRPFGPAGVERNFMRAEEQVKRQLLPSGDRGAIAMSLTGVVVPRNSWLRGRDGADLSRSLDRHLENGVVRYQHFCRTQIHSASVGGVLFAANCVGIDLSRPRYVLCGGSMILPLAEDSTASGRLVRKLTDKLKGAAM